MIAYFTYACSSSAQQNMRLNLLSYSQSQNKKESQENSSRVFVSHKQILNVLVVLLLPVLVTLLAVYAFARLYSGYGDGSPLPLPVNLRG